MICVYRSNDCIEKGSCYWVIKRKVLFSGGIINLGQENKILAGIECTDREFSLVGGMSKFSASGRETPLIPSVGKTLCIHILGKIGFCIQIQEKNKINYDDDELFLWNGWPMKGVKPYFQLGPLSEILTIIYLRLAASRI